MRVRSTPSHVTAATRLLSGLCLLQLAASCLAGDLTGTIRPPGACRSVKAVSRPMKLEYEGVIDAKTGRFEIRNLPAGRLDLVLALDGAVLHGVDLDMGPHDAADAKLTDDDRKTISTWIVDNFRLGKEFENKGRPIYIVGNGKHCKVLVEKIRDRAFHAGKGQAVYRVEIWVFDKLYGTWRKRAHAEQVVLRERLPMADFRKRAYFFDPKVGGIEVGGKGEITTLEYVIPQTLGPSMGKPAE